MREPNATAGPKVTAGKTARLEHLNESLRLLNDIFLQQVGMIRGSELTELDKQSQKTHLALLKAIELEAQKTS